MASAISYSYANHACRNLAASSPSKNIQMFFFKAVQFIHHRLSDRLGRVATRSRAVDIVYNM